MFQNALILLANGFEELEAFAPVDVFRRAGAAVTLAGVGADPAGSVTSAHGVSVRCDVSVDALDPAKEWDLVYFPGGMPGSRNLASSPACQELARSARNRGAWLCAICAAPMALDAAGVLDGVEYTCYPGTERQLRSGIYTGRYIQRSGRILTACGPAAALDFALEILRAAGAAPLAAQLSAGMMVRKS